MKKLYLLLFSFAFLNLYAQNTDDVLNLLINNKTITQEQADSLRAEAAIKQQTADANKKSFLVSAARQIQISGFTQIRYQALDEKNKNDGFDIRRARLDFKGNMNSFFSYRLQADLVEKPKILDAYAEITINDFLKITVGQFTIPFSLENITSSSKYEMIDFSQAVDAMAARGKDVIGNQNGHDIGIQIGGTLLKKGNSNFLEYRLGVFNGSGINIADTSNEAKDIAARLIANPLKGLSFGASYYNGWGKAIKPAAEFTGRSQARNRLGFEASYTTSKISLKSEYISGTDGKTDRAGWYVMAGYFVIPSKWQILAKYDTYDPNTGASRNNSTWYTGGFNYHFNNWSRIQAFYTFREEEGENKHNNFLSIQYQIGF